MSARFWDSETIARAAAMKRAGMSTAQIAERLGVTVSAVRNAMNKSGVNKRLDGSRGRRRKFLPAILANDPYDHSEFTK